MRKQASNIVMSDHVLIPVWKRSGIAAWSKCDLDHADHLSQFRWHLNNNGYACRTAKKISMQREILKYSGKMDVDHINRDKLDNRSRNLRIVTRSVNAQNSKSSGKSKYLGVSLKKDTGRWAAQISFNWKRIYGGYFATEIEAAIKYNQMALELFGPNARLNEV